MDTSPEKGGSTLRPRARIMRTLGDELISSDDVAIVELIKNSYDADASRVFVRFSNDKIEVIDNGHGMQLSTIRNVWMEPATLFKKLYTHSEQGRRVLGNKGIGRFASSRLANNLQIVTRRKGSPTEVVARFDWTDFDDESKYLDEIIINWFERSPEEICADGVIKDLWNEQVETVPSISELEHGTVLTMTGLRSNWDYSKVKNLRVKLARLVSPIGTGSINSEFVVRVTHPEQQELDDRVNVEELFTNPPYTLSGNVNPKGEYELTIYMRGDPSSSFIHGKYSPIDGYEPKCGPFTVDLKIWDRDSKSLNYMVDEDSTLKNIRKILDTVSGVSIYRDEFRVLPYGEPHNDWLRLDNRSRQNPTLRLANNQIIGTISITADDNPKLQDQSNREGIIEGPALTDLREIFKGILGEVELLRYRAKRSDSQEKKRKRGSSSSKGLFADFNLESLRDTIFSKYPEDDVLLAAFRDNEKIFKGKLEQIQDVLSRYRRLSTLGQLVDVVLHEGRHPVAKIKNEVQLAKRDILRGVSQTERTLSCFRVIENQSDVLSDVFRRVEPFSGRRQGGAESYVLEAIIKESFEVVQATIDELGVRVDLPNTSTVLIVERTEIQEVMLNLINNSLYWIKNVPKDKREIGIRINPGNDSSLTVLFSDSGPGVSKEDKDYIFDPYFTRKPDGVGLGLTIAGEIVTDYYSGSLELVENGPLPGATFRITLNERV